MRPIRLVTLLALAGFGVVAVPAAAQTTPPPSTPASMPAPAQHGSRMMGTHTMQCTVTSVDKQTGLMEVTAHGMSLRLHFPPTVLADVNAGDTIAVHLSFSK